MEQTRAEKRVATMRKKTIEAEENSNQEKQAFKDRFKYLRVKNGYSQKELGGVTDAGSQPVTDTCTLVQVTNPVPKQHSQNPALKSDTGSPVADSAFSEAARCAAKLPLHGRHQFTYHARVHSLRKMRALLKQSVEVLPLSCGRTKLSVDLRAFLKELDVYETDASKFHHGRYVLLDVFEVLLPTDFDMDLCADFAKFLIAAVFDNKLPHFVRLRKKGKARYLDFYYSDREYYAVPKQVNIVRASDFWRDPVTGHRCNPTKKGAVKVWSKGDFVRAETIKFSKKTRHFAMSDGAFLHFNSQLKHACRSYFDSHGFVADKTALIARLKLSSMWDKQKCKKKSGRYIAMKNCNALFQKMEDKIRYAFQTMQYLGFTHDDCEPLNSVIIWARKLSTTGRLRYKVYKRSYTLFLSLSNGKSLDQNLQVALAELDRRISCAQMQIAGKDTALIREYYDPNYGNLGLA